VVIYYYGYVFTEGIPADRWLRAHQTEEKLVIRDLSEGLPEGSNGYSFQGPPVDGHLATILCVQGYCGGIGEPSADAREERYESFDGGLTWKLSTSIELPDGTYIAGTRSDGATIAFHYDPNDGSYEWFTWPDRQPVTPPEPGAIARMIDGRLVWRTYASNSPDTGGSIYDETGNVIAAPIEPPLPGPFDFVREGVLDLAWWLPWPRDAESTAYISEVAASGTVLRTVKARGFDPALIGWIDEDTIVVRRWGSPDASLADAALIDLETGAMNRIDGLQPTEKDRDVYVTEVVVGDFAMVDAPGSCLHVRAAAGSDSESLECYADGVLFEVTGEAMVDAAGVEWLPVRAPGGIDGYASTEFLLR
jgi:hypothetical protein